MNANSKIPHEQNANQSFNWKIWEAFQKNTPNYIPFLVNVPSKMVGPLYHGYLWNGENSHGGFFKIVQGAPPGDIEGVVFFGRFFFHVFWGVKGWGMVGMVILKIWIGDGDSECGGLVILKILDWGWWFWMWGDWWFWKFGLVVPDSFWGWFFWGNIFHQNQQDPKEVDTVDASCCIWKSGALGKNFWCLVYAFRVGKMWVVTCSKKMQEIATVWWLYLILSDRHSKIAVL